MMRKSGLGKSRRLVGAIGLAGIAAFAAARPAAAEDMLLNEAVNFAGTFMYEGPSINK